MLDADGSGEITYEEMIGVLGFGDTPELRKAFDKYDANGNGNISRKEFDLIAAKFKVEEALDPVAAVVVNGSDVASRMMQVKAMLRRAAEIQVAESGRRPHAVGS